MQPVNVIVWPEPAVPLPDVVPWLVLPVVVPGVCDCVPSGLCCDPPLVVPAPCACTIARPPASVTMPTAA